MSVKKQVKIWALSCGALCVIGIAVMSRPAVEGPALTLPVTFSPLSRVDLEATNTVPFREDVIAGIYLRPGENPDDLPVDLKDQLRSFDQSSLGMRPFSPIMVLPSRTSGSRDDDEKGFFSGLQDLDSYDTQLGGKWIEEPSWGWLADDVLKAEKGGSSDDSGYTSVPGYGRRTRNTSRDREHDESSPW